MNDFKIAHWSDLHAGYKATRLLNNQGINLREADGYLALSRITQEAIDEGVNCVIVSGDIFHTPTPEIRSIIFVQNQLRKLASASIPVYMLAGNHDTNDVRADIAASRILHDPDRKLYSHVEPYVKYEISDGIWLHLISHHMYGDQGATMLDVKPVNDAINIFATHGSIIDPILKIKLHTEHSPREIVIPDFIFDDYNWDYAFLGHIHERGFVGSKDGVKDTNNSRIYYNGSLIRRGFSDKAVPLGRGWTLWTIDSSGEFTPVHKKVAQRPQIDFKVIDANNKSPQQISDEMVENLKETQSNGNVFDAKIAPILRQRIKNVEPAKMSALDSRSLALNSQHALHYSRKILSPEETESRESKFDFTPFDSTDVVKIYDEWAKDSEKLSNVADNLKNTVQKQTRGFVELGQEVILND